MRRTVPLLGGRAVNRVLAINAQRAVNYRPEAQPSGAKSLLTLRPTEGLVLLTTQGNGPCRSHFVEFDEETYWVSGSQLFSMDSAWNVTTIGSLTTTSGWCVLAAGRDYLMLVDGTDGYTWDGSTFAAIGDADFVANPTWCEYIDGYFLVNNRNSDRWSISELTGGNEDPTAWNALDFATAEADPDDVVVIERVAERLMMMGTKTVQVYTNSGNADFPFELVTNGVLEWGVESPASVDVVEGVVFLLSRSAGGGLAVLMVTGFQAQSIAPPDIIEELDGYVTSNAEGYAYKMGGKTFYELTLPSENLTLEYCVETGFWHERSSYEIGRHRTRGHGFFNRRHLVGDFNSGNVYYLDGATYTENGQPIIRTRVTSIVAADGRDLECHSFEVEFARGVGLLSGQGSVPTAMMRYSCDGGNTWSSLLYAPMAPRGDYDLRTMWNRLGQAGSYMWEVSVSDPIDATMVGINADLEFLGE